MLNNYIIDTLGVIKQDKVEPFVYDNDYINHYVDLDETGQGKKMSKLRYDLMKNVIKKDIKTILDVGCGSGAFIKYCEKQGIENVFGMDLVKTNNIIYKEDFNDEYDVITFYDSLEHFQSLDFLDTIKTKFLIISLPWCNYVSDDWFLTWKHRKENEHIWFFNDISLEKFMNSKGFYKIHLSNIEDTIRISSEDTPNILTMIFKKF